MTRDQNGGLRDAVALTRCCLVDDRDGAALMLRNYDYAEALQLTLGLAFLTSHYLSMLAEVIGAPPDRIVQLTLDEIEAQP